MLIHKEGKKILMQWLLILLAINVASHFIFRHTVIPYLIFAISAFYYGMMLNFFKKPKRIYNGMLLGAVNAPTDGRIVVIEKVFEKDFLNKECIQISIFMSFFNAHSNWMPVTGKIIHLSHEMGHFHAAYLPKSSSENERTNIVIETPDGYRILTRQIAGAMAKRIVTYVKEGNCYTIGDPLGFIKLGSRMDIFLPIESEILVKMKQEVHANKTFLAHLPSAKKLEQMKK
ncbi:MAG TPA: phosphatidylserine decarboxylase family protein [Dysgonamonadaceae bacterium]|jgi:phosphatidylserine decarboxylase|nr:phosphatidylserine decarboxylase family protein [Dysgonamonadaceae bacterium]HQF11329.1 phosphatidylserine decarboxylase family protein [Paludibacteraceae bacterium]HOT63927.1 phosphatidylserine decarboxylase family protein [Dysgonamonadaceae bacterium]HOV35071.1 phosphatidylserine decarboxylase family protein [Dysgonamonadaceae bacterium]HPD43539.1 phosphatidylserine decarboxylase family protein [Dysgonamonadaceae bacterium]